MARLPPKVIFSPGTSRGTPRLVGLGVYSGEPGQSQDLGLKCNPAHSRLRASEPKWGCVRTEGDGQGGSKRVSLGGRDHEEDRKFGAGLDTGGDLCGGDFVGGGCTGAGAGGEADGLRAERFSLAG